MAAHIWSLHLLIAWLRAPRNWSITTSATPRSLIIFRYSLRQTINMYANTIHLLTEMKIIKLQRNICQTEDLGKLDNT